MYRKGIRSMQAEAYPSLLTSDFLSFLEEELSDWIIDCILEFGGQAKEEATSSSDYDLFVVFHSDDRIHVSQPYMAKNYYEEFLSRWKGFTIIGGDLRDQVNQKWSRAHGGSKKIWISYPLFDVRWLMQVLAMESDGFAFIYITPGFPLLDENSFHKDLIATMNREKPFHWSEDSGIIHTLRGICGYNKHWLTEDLKRIRAGEKKGLEHEIPWIHPAVYTFRDSIALYIFAKTGFPEWTRTKILNTIKNDFPTYYELAQRVYDSKCTDDGRARFMNLLENDSPKLVKELEPLTDSLASFWDEIFKKIDVIKNSNATPIPSNIPEWKERNLNIYDGFLDRYLARNN